MITGCAQIIDLIPKQTATQALAATVFANAGSLKDPTIGEFMTEDAKTIAYSYYENPEAKFGVVLLHMLDRDRHDWDNFAKVLQMAGYNVLTIDFRGHSNSTKGWKWRAFSDRDFQSMTLDVKGATDFLAQKNITNVILIGASIGANTALNYGVDAKNVRAIVLLSPGLDYRTVRVLDSAEKNNKPTLLIASKADLYAWTTSQQIYELAKNKTKDYQYYEDAGHGTDIFKKEKADLYIADWLMQKGFS